MGFQEKLVAAIESNNSLLCVGLDPQLEMLPPGASIGDRLTDWGKTIISQTADLVCCYKPNFAFYEQFGLEGLKALQNTIAAIPKNLPVLLDVKRGDIGSTASALAAAAFDQWGADAVTLSPYLGEDSVKPFLDHEGSAVFILSYTSNPSAAQIQQHGVPPLYQQVIQTASHWGQAGRIAFVVGATQPDELAAVRRLSPESWILAPGVGAQGGDLNQALRAGLRQDGSGLIVPVSRAVLAARNPRQAAQDLRESINRERKNIAASAGIAPLPYDHLIPLLFEAGCIKFGSFTLASGKLSPVYVDLRRVVSYPHLFKEVCAAYAQEASRLEFDLIAGVPYAALPAAAVVACQTGMPMIYPRKEVKQHGTGQAIEGNFASGQRAALIEDVATTGGSIITAAETLRAAGLQVKDAVVLVDREQGGSAALAEGQIALHSVLKFSHILDVLMQKQLIDEATFKNVKDYLHHDTTG
jgi:uridine monophosphate synthetase